MRHGTIILVGLAVLALVSPPAVADTVELVPTSLLGGFNAVGAYGTPQLRFVGGNGGVAVPGKPTGGRFGAAFDGTVWVESVTITQYDTKDQYVRKCIETVDVYADGVYVGWFTMDNGYGDHEVPFADRLYGRDGKLVGPVQANWLTLVVKSQYGQTTEGVFCNDSNTGIWYTFHGQPASSTGNHLVNLNAGRAEYVTVTGALGGFEGAGPRAVDGMLVSDSDAGAVFWPYNSNAEKSLTVSYADLGPVIVERVGIALAGEGSFNRPAPKWVIISGSDGQWVKIDLGSDDLEDPENPGFQIQYNRYALPTNFGPTEWLKISFPTGSSSDDWWFYSDPNVGLVEFQAFGYVYDPVPEPATMILLALGGGLALRRRRK